MVKSPTTQLEIAAHWLEEAATEFAALKRRDFADNCRRVSNECKAALRQASKEVTK